MKEIKNVVILGGGTAGWLAAYIMSDFFYSNKLNANVKVIRSLCHYTLVIKDGKVIEEGITKDVLDNPINEYTKQLVQSAFEVIGE